MSAIREISLTQPLSQAIERVKRLLFRPFDPVKWLVIGFCAWLAQLGEGGFNGGTGFHSPMKGGGTAPNFHQWFDQSRSFVLMNLSWIIPVVATVVVFGLALWAVIIWLNSRGQFMFLHCVALERAEVRVPWRQYAAQAKSLFLFRLVLTASALLVTLPSAAGLVFFLLSLLPNNATAATVTGIIALIGLFLLSMAFVFIWLIINKLTTDFVVPIQFVRGCRCREAWSSLLELMSRHPGEFVLYFLFQIVLAIAIFAIVLVLFLITCCIACCLLALPYIGTVLLLPILAFKRAYSLHYLGQYGPEYSPVTGS